VPSSTARVAGGRNNDIGRDYRHMRQVLFAAAAGSDDDSGGGGTAGEVNDQVAALRAAAAKAREDADRLSRVRCWCRTTGLQRSAASAFRTVC